MAAGRGVAAASGLLLLLAACEPGRQASEPPKRYQGDAVAAVSFQTSPTCGGATHEAGVSVEACAGGGWINAPNPCQWPGTDTYAQLLCHEVGHVNGWPANHPAN